MQLCEHETCPELGVQPVRFVKANFAGLPEGASRYTEKVYCGEHAEFVVRHVERAVLVPIAAEGV